MTPTRLVLSTLVAVLAVAGCSSAATVLSPAPPSSVPATSIAATLEPVPTPTPATPTEVVAASPTAPPSAVAGCLDSAVRDVLYAGLKDPGSLTDDQLATLRTGIEAWTPADAWQEMYRDDFLATKDTLAFVAGSLSLRSGERTIEACP